MSEHIPVILVTGFLGAGKTTLINAVLRDPRLTETAVLINEFGDTPIDNDLILEFSPDLVVTTTGCICCTASSDVRQSLFDLWSRRTARKIGPFRRVIIETTGLADPAPVIHALTAPPGVSLVERIVGGQFALASVVTALDAACGVASAHEHIEALKQVALADALVLTKTDLREPGERQKGEADVAQLVREANPAAFVFDKAKHWQSLVDWLVAERLYDRASRSEDALAWLKAEAVMGEQSNPHAHADRNLHGDGIRAHCITIDDPIPPQVFNFFLNALQRSAGPSLLRVKGLFALSDDPDRPVVVHGVQHLVHAVDKLPRWPSADRRSRLVVIGRDLNIKAMRSVLESRPKGSGWLGRSRRAKQNNQNGAKT